MISGKFLGPTKGNRDININLTSSSCGGSGESHPGGAGKGKFLGETKGNRDLPINRTSGVSGGYGGKHKAGG